MDEINLRFFFLLFYFAGGIDPYVLIQYKGQERKSTVARGQGSSPVWNETFTFRAEYPGGNDEYKLILKIMDHDTFSADDYLGQSTIYVKELLETGVQDGKAEIHPQKYSIVSSDQSFNGEIKVGISFIPKVESYDAGEDFGGWKESEY
ncbi:OLC1v1027612C1 [Oldenlandia corymbosa var. corymbosa]|uniref:OLC1v1027612C1 n=1 Tax=Oldenlandia corymbosa var. corymbosa TaxID=529605 RepID=A0AAV1CAD9_OLDCO|nr:OLC1v1027612C1 [Oldenlandia corymbosa var. corymbosa]